MLERFCVVSPELLQGRMIVYKDIERSGWHDGLVEETSMDDPDEMSEVG